MVNWIKKMQADNASLKEQVKTLQKQLKKGGKTPSEDKTSSHLIVKLKHRISSLKESLNEYRSVIEKYAQENAAMKKGTKAAEDATAKKLHVCRIRFRKAIKVINFLDCYLEHLPPHVIAKLSADPGLELYQDMVERFVTPKDEKTVKGD